MNDEFKEVRSVFMELSISNLGIAFGAGGITNFFLPINN